MLLKSIEVMIAQKQRNLQNIKDKTVGLVKTALEITQEIPVNQPAENFDYVGVDMVEDLTPEAGIESEEAVAEEDSPAITPPKRARTQKTRPANRRKAAEKGRVKRADKPREEPAERSQNITDIKCLHHPESPVLDQARQLCSSCRWKLINNGLLKFDKEPEVISFLKGC
jgi:hypothetical protein